MKVSDAFFVDSGVWHAWFDDRDQWHRAVRGVFLEFQELRTPLVTSDLILIEYMTLAKSRGVPAERIERNIVAIEGTAFIDRFRSDDFDSIRRVQLRLHYLALSSFDASILVSTGRQEVARLFSIDSEFLRCGQFVEVRPRRDERLLAT